MKYLLALGFLGMAKGELLCSSVRDDTSFCNGANMIYDHTKDNVDCGDACTQDHCCTEFTLISSGTCENTAEYYNPDDTQCETYKKEEHGSNGQYKGHGWDDAFHNGAYSHISHPAHCTTRYMPGTVPPYNGDTFYNIHHDSPGECTANFPCICLIIPTGYNAQDIYKYENTESSCEDTGFTSITTREDCKEALAHLEGIQATEVSLVEYPEHAEYRKGCHFATSFSAIFTVNNPPDAVGNPASCATSGKCICKMTVVCPDGSHHDGTACVDASDILEPGLPAQTNTPAGGGCPEDTSGMTAAEYINAQCCQCPN